MTQAIWHRAVTTVPVLIGVTFLVFSLMRLIPGDVVDLMLEQATYRDPAHVAYLRELYGLDRPLWEQYAGWITKVARGDLGKSLWLNSPVAEEMLLRLPVTIELTIIAVVTSVLLAIPLGLVSAVKQDTLGDSLARVFALLGLSMPNFWLGTMLVLFLSLYVPDLVPSGYVSLFDDPMANLKVMLLAGLVLGYHTMGTVARMTRSATLEVLREEYVLTGRAKGLSEKVLIFRHVLKNALNPVLTILGIQVGFLLGGAVVIEHVFVLPGIGSLLLQGIHQRDYPVVQAVVLFIAVVFVAVNFLVDVAYSYLDPRIRLS